ncbi:MFS transporter, DHA2 family, methylenomycin A resistance protein [Actinacidiphila paucisporea]|uniref:MFS transporter, DHA2 family, methylenomycin A resistance protein n=2 Tax=Actinacidiphila paucisporea TaxID=310782 RepID=A0A1M6ZMY3_9ACTN|nr:MFS transporter, DHA2 family, methylenomycin A resistance protein [Actinacidiphila paucisporea]
MRPGRTLAALADRTTGMVMPGMSPDRKPYALIGIALGYFMVLLDMTVLSVAEPDLSRSLGGSVAGLQWAVTGYTVAFGALLLSAGAAADRFGAHRLFRGGVAVFGAGSLLCAAAPGLWTLVVLRGVLGAAAAACVPSSMALITRLYPEPARRARAVSVWAAVSGAALAAGPIAGGLLVGLAGWRAVFLVNVPIAALTLALVSGSAVHCPAAPDRRVDRTGQALACAALALGTDALIALGGRHWAHTACSFGAAIATGGLFAARERRSTSPVLAGAVLRAPGMAAMLLAGAAVGFALTGALFVLPLLLQQRLGYSAVGTGLAFLPMTLPTAFNPLLTGRLVARTGPRGPVLAGLCLLTAGAAAMGATVWAGAPYAFLAAGLAAAGFGVSFALPALTTAVITLAPEGTAGSAGGLFNAVRQLGATMGVAVLGAFATVAPHRGGGRADHGVGGALLLAAAVCAVCATVASAGRRRSPQPAAPRPLTPARERQP